MNRKLRNSRSEARLRDNRKKSTGGNSVASGLSSHRSAALPLAMMKGSRKMSQSQPQTERGGLASTLISARSTLMSRPPLPSKRSSNLLEANNERLSLHVAQQLSQIRLKYSAEKYRQKRPSVDYMPIVDKHKQDIHRYDEVLTHCSHMETELTSLKTRIRQLQETKRMMSEDLQSQCNERVAALISKEQCEELLELYNRQYPQQAYLISKQEELNSTEEGLQRQLKLIRQCIRRNQQKWSECQRNLNVRSRHLHLSEIIKSTRLQLLEREDQCNVQAATLKVKTLRHLICSFVKQHEQKSKLEKENGTEVWLCANGLVGAWVQSIEVYKKTVSNSELSKSLDSYAGCLKQLEGVIHGKDQCTALRKHHQSISQHYQTQIERIHKQLQELSCQRLQFKNQLDLLLAKQKEIHLKDLDIEYVDSKAISTVLHRVNSQQNNRIQRIKENKQRLKEAESYLNNHLPGEESNSLPGALPDKQLNQQISALQTKMRLLVADLDEQSTHKKALEKKLSNAVGRMRQSSRDQLQTKIQSLCYHLGRMEKHITQTQEKSTIPILKQALSIIPETISQRKPDLQSSKGSTLKNGFQTNRDLLKSTCLSYFNKNDPTEAFTRLPLPGSKAQSIRSSMVATDDLRPAKLSFGCSTALYTRTTR